MKNIKHCGWLLALALLTAAASFFFASMAAKDMANVGTFIGIGGVALAGWRLSSGSNAALQDIAVQQRSADFFGSKHHVPEDNRLELNLPAGALFLSSLTWVVLMQMA